MIHKKRPQTYRINRLERKREEIRQAEVAAERTRDGGEKDEWESRKCKEERRKGQTRAMKGFHAVSYRIILHNHTHTHIHTLLSSTALNQSHDMCLDGSHYIPLTFGHHTNNYWRCTRTHKISLALSPKAGERSIYMLVRINQLALNEVHTLSVSYLS